MKRLFWIHDEQIALPQDRQPDEPCVFIWDTDYFAQQAWSLNRLVFIYESLTQLDLNIYLGNTIATLEQLQSLYNIDTICVQQPTDPILNKLVQSVSQSLNITLTNSPSWLNEDPLKPSKRFYAYWQQVAAQLGVHDTQRGYERLHQVRREKNTTKKQRKIR